MKFDLLSKILGKKEEKRDYFWGIILRPTGIVVLLYEQSNGLLSIKATHKEKLSEDKSFEADDLLTAVDLAITNIEQRYPQLFVKNAIFGVPNFWVEGGKIKKEFLYLLKTLCDNLDLSPLGFIVYEEAIVQLFQEKEGAPTSGIFVEFEKNHAFVYVVRAGNILETIEQEGRETIVKTLEIALKKVKTFDVLPSKIVITDDGLSQEEYQELLSYSWTKNLPFLHFPKVLTLEEGFTNEALTYGIAKEVNAQVVQELASLHKEEEYKEESKETALPDEEKIELGFLKEEDILKKEKVKEALQEAAVQENLPPRNLSRTNLLLGKIQTLLDPVKTVLAKDKIKNRFIFLFSNLNLKNFRDFLKPPGFNRSLLRWVLVAASFLVIFIFLYYFLVLRAEVIVFVAEKKMQGNFSAVLSKEEETNIDKGIVNVKNIDVVEEGEKTIDVSGKKETGEKAHGEVIIYNKTEEAKTFPAGTIIIGPNNLQFETKDTVKVASTSAFATTFSSAKASVVAKNFGSEYNLPSNTNLSFKNYPTSSFFAKNESAFLGGTKKEISVVSDKDIFDLANLLTSDLSKKAKEDVKAKIKENEELISSILKSEFVEKSYDKKTQEEAKTLSLSAKIRFSGFYFDKKNVLLSIGRKEGISSDFVLNQEKSKIEIRNAKEGKDGRISADVYFDLVFLPRIDEQKLKNKLVRKSLNQAKVLAEKESGVSGATIILKNRIFLLPAFLPANPSSIIVKIKQENQ